MRTILALVAALLLLAASAAAQEQPVQVRSEVDRATMAIGDHILFTLIVDLAPGHDLMEPRVPRTIGDFEVVDTLTALQTRGQSGATRIQLRYLITAFTLGAKELPRIEVTYRGPSGQGVAATATGHRIQVESVIQPGEDTNDIKPLKPPLAVPGTMLESLQRMAPYALLAVLALALLIGAIVYLRRRRPEIVAEVDHGPARRALDELERVAGLRLPEQGRTREHYGLLDAALRRYAAERYALPAHSRTARELRRELERSKADRAQAQLLYDVLHDAESVRYQEQVIYPARAQKTMHDLIEVMRKSVIAEEYELIETGGAS